MILLIVALAQPAPVPSAETLRKYPPVVMVAPPAPPAPPPAMPSLSLLGPAGQQLVKAQDEKVAALDTARRAGQTTLMEKWVDALEADRFDPARVIQTGAAVDAALGRPGVFAGWAEVMTRLSPDDRKVLLPRLRSSSGRVYFQTLSPPMITLPSASVEARRTPLNQGMAALLKRMEQEGAARDARRKEIERARAEATAIARRKPFDAAVTKAAFRRVQALRNANELQSSDATIDAIATLPADQRDALIDVLWRDPRIVPVPPAPRAK